MHNNNTTLGLDLGPNSIGWALIENDSKLIDAGVRIFPVGVKEDDYNKSGKEISKNSARRNARGIRRLYDRYKIRRKQLIKTLSELNMMPPESMNFLKSFDLYKLRRDALEKQLTLHQIGRIFLLLNQRRGFKSNKKDNKKSSEAKKELEGILGQMEELSRKVKESNCRTIGEYFYSLFLKTVEKENWHNPDEPVERIRNRFVYRKLYEEEFDYIWNIQKKYYPNILTGGKEEYDNIKKVECLTERKTLLTEFKKTNYYRIKLACIFYQRPLKSQKHLVSRCRFEPSKRTAPKSSFAFQEFRLWQMLNILRITDNVNRFSEKLTLEEMKKLADYLTINESISRAKLNSLLGLSKKAFYQKDMPDKLKGNITFASLYKALGEKFLTMSKNDKDKLWHTLYFANDEEWLYGYSKEKLYMSDEEAKRYSEINLEPDYGSVSIKAINKILRFLKEGQIYSDACASAGYHHSQGDDPDGDDEKIILTKKDQIKNPLVQQAVSESAKVVNEIIKQYGKPQTIRVELARELKWSKEKREKLKRALDKKNLLRDEFKKFLQEKGILINATKEDLLKFELWLEMGFYENELHKLNPSITTLELLSFCKDVRIEDKEKFNLWLECGRTCPYTGKVISLYELFSPYIEIEHIIPYSRSLDNSFSNKTITTRDFNHLKSNLTPYEYFKDNPGEWFAFQSRIKNFPEKKRERFLMKEIPSDFINQQLTNTAYIAIEVKNKLKRVCKNVVISNGQVTAQLRRFWGLNKILNPDGENLKSRHDHRHHAIDALTIACTSNRYIQLLSTAAQFDYHGIMKIKNVPFPFDNFYEQAKERVSTIFISYKNNKRLITTKYNKYIHSSSGKQKKTKNISIRGPLHEETFYGQINHPITGENTYVVRKPLSSFDKVKQIESIVDPVIKEIVLKQINKYDGDIKKALAEPIYIFSKDKKKKIPIKKVRVKDSSKDLIQLRPGENPNLFVSSGSNYLIAIYEGLDGKRTYDTISFYQAVQKIINKQSLVNFNYKGKSLLYTLRQKDMVVVYEKHPDEINWDNKFELFERLYRVIKMDQNGNIILGRHNLSSIKADKDTAPTVLRKSVNTIKIQKIKISVTGQLIKLND